MCQTYFVDLLLLSTQKPNSLTMFKLQTKVGNTSESDIVMFWHLRL